MLPNAAASYSRAQVTLDSVPKQNFDTDHYQDFLRNQDSLAEQRELNREKLASLKAQAQSQRFAIETVERKIDRLERQQSILEQKRSFETSTQQQAIFKSGVARTDSARSTLLRQIETGEQTIQATEAAIEKSSQQLINVQAELERAQKPLREIEAQVRKINYSDRLSYFNHAEVGSIPARPAKAPSRPALPARPALTPRPALPALPPNAARPAPPAKP